MKHIFKFLALACAFVLALHAPAFADSSPPPLSKATIAAAGGALKTDIAQQNPFSVIVAKLASGQSAILQVWGDSTTIDSTAGVIGVGDRRYYGQWADQLITSGRLDKWSPGAGLRIYQWVAGSYPTANIETIRTSSNGVYFDIYLGGVSGSVPQYFQGNYFLPALATIPADGMLMSQGINMFTHGAVPTEGQYVAAIEQYREPHPDVPIGLITEHPNRDATSYDFFRDVVKAKASKWGVYVIDYPFAAFLAAGKPSSWYNSDGIHQSPTLGCAPYIKALNDVWDAAVPQSAPNRTSRFIERSGSQQLLVNGDFTTWTNTAAVPDGWTAAGTITFSKDAAKYATARKPSSVRMISGGTGQTSITQTIGTGVLPGQLACRPLTFAARLSKDNAGASTLGRISLSWSGSTSGANSATSVSNIIQQNGFVWQVLTVTMPCDLTTLTARIYVDSSATPDPTYGIWLDQASLVIGGMPSAW